MNPSSPAHDAGALRDAHRQSASRVLVIGAAGNTGRSIVHRLTELGVPVRAATRGGKMTDNSAEPVRFDWADEASHDTALAGVDRMYLIAPGLVDDPSPLMLPFIERALKRGVRRAVLLSASAIPEGAAGLGAVHHALRERMPEWTVLQPSWFMQNFAAPRHHHAASIQREGRLVTATGQGRVGFVDARDIAEVAVRALTDARAHDTAHVITGPQALGYDDIAGILAQVTGRPVRHQSVSPDEAQRHMEASGIPAPYARFLAQLEETIRDGAEDRVTQTVSRVTGREPRTFEAFAREHAAHWR
ncbi:NmrA family NAD(P)-binding protein [Myxococcus vastator]|uniref:NmrA family NAD(P)-binding protein n=1 Tax=Myxococcus vastator TaxID=2709664 RepID=UPI0013D59D52|nr:NmrA family NAD(P)-binding protein [Myxococcus vastator]